MTAFDESRRAFLADFRMAYASAIRSGRFEGVAWAERATKLCTGQPRERYEGMRLIADCMAIMREEDAVLK